MTSTHRFATPARPGSNAGDRTPANEAEAKLNLRRAIVDFGHHSPAAEAALRHFDLIRRFNARYAWMTH